MAVATAMMQTLGDEFSIFARIESQGVNESDVASGVTGDVMCYDENDQMVLAVEVKDRTLTLADVRTSTRKERESDPALSDLLFAAPSIKAKDRVGIHESTMAAWASGLNVYQVDIVDLAASVFVLLPEEWRPKLLRQIGKELDMRGDHKHRRAWYSLLSAFGENKRAT